MNGLCILCKEPITTPLTRDNVGKHIELWLPTKYRDQFQQLNTVLERHVTDFFCVDARAPGEELVCMHCYVKEVHQWLKRLDASLAERLLEAFSFGYSKKSFESEDIRLPEGLEGEEREFGICDECGEYCNNLSHDSGEWLCEECAHFR